MKKPVEEMKIIYTKVSIGNETHYLCKDGKTYCGMKIPEGIIGSNTIGIITCNRCVNIYINTG